MVINNFTPLFIMDGVFFILTIFIIKILIWKK
jgi:hypothetical protein